MTIKETVKSAATVALSDRRYTYAAIIGILVGIGVYALWFYRIDPVYTWVGGLMFYVQAGASQLASWAQTAIGSLGSYFQTNPAAAATATLATAGAVYGIVSKIRADRLTARTQIEAAAQVTQAEKAAISASQKLTLAQDQIKTLETQVEAYKTDNSFVDAQKIIGEQSSRIMTLQATVAELEHVIEGLKVAEKVVVH